MSSLDLSGLSGADAVVALRSFPRRYRAVAASVPGDPDNDEWAFRVGPGGHSTIDIIVHTTNTFTLLAQALHEVLVSPDPTLHPAVGDGAQREWDLPPGCTLREALEQFDSEAGALADAVSHVRSRDWSRGGQVAGAGAMTTLDLVREAVRVGADGLKGVETAAAAVRH